MSRFSITSNSVLLHNSVCAYYLGLDPTALSDEDESVISPLAAAAQRWAEGYLGIAIGPKTIIAYYDALDVNWGYVLPIGNITEMSGNEFEYYNPAMALTTVSGLSYFFTVGSNKVFFYKENESLALPEISPVGEDRVMIHYIAGFPTADDVDPRIVQAMLLKIKHWYVNRADSALTTDDSADLRTATELLDQVLKEIQS